MKAVDDRILEYLDSHGTASPQIIAESDDIFYNRDYIGRRLRQLTEAGLVEKVGRGVYRITGEGTEYLTGTRDLRDLEEPE
ncbi:MAG: MarR family transcriptional regulator [Halapricum sp.]